MFVVEAARRSLLIALCLVAGTDTAQLLSAPRWVAIVQRRTCLSAAATAAVTYLTTYRYAQTAQLGVTLYRKWLIRMACRCANFAQLFSNTNQLMLANTRRLNHRSLRQQGQHIKITRT